jgi:hypothetical protein
MKFREVTHTKINLDSEGYIAEDLQHAVRLSVITKCPEKYLLIDQETGQIYQGSSETNPYMPNYCLWKPIDLKVAPEAKSE